MRLPPQTRRAILLLIAEAKALLNPKQPWANEENHKAAIRHAYLKYNEANTLITEREEDLLFGGTPYTSPLPQRAIRELVNIYAQLAHAFFNAGQWKRATELYDFLLGYHDNLKPEHVRTWQVRRASASLQHAVTQRVAEPSPIEDILALARTTPNSTHDRDQAYAKACAAEQRVANLKDHIDQYLKHAERQTAATEAQMAETIANEIRQLDHIRLQLQAYLEMQEHTHQPARTYVETHIIYKTQAALSNCYAALHQLDKSIGLLHQAIASHAQQKALLTANDRLGSFRYFNNADIAGLHFAVRYSLSKFNNQLQTQTIKAFVALLNARLTLYQHTDTADLPILTPNEINWTKNVLTYANQHSMLNKLKLMDPRQDTQLARIQQYRTERAYAKYTLQNAQPPEHPEAQRRPRAEQSAFWEAHKRPATSAATYRPKQ